METKAWHFIDKSEWARGPWDDEPDKLQWQDAATGLACLIHRAGVTGALCGYVGVPPGHPLHGKDYDAARDGVTVHGGLTFAGACGPVSDDGQGICHEPGPGEPDALWWLGFDCGHAMDISPVLDALMRRHGSLANDAIMPGRYRDIDYVKSHCAALAKQIAKEAA